MKKNILFVCLGNICRSPSAEAVFKHLVEKKGEEGNFFIDSAGTSAWHAGEKADARMRRHAKKRGIELTSISRKFVPEDFDRFDYIIAMDRENMDEMKRMARNKNDLDKLHMMTDFSQKFNYHEIPDPYYGGDEGFELVLDLLEDANKGLLDHIKSS
ncbi:MAG: low molecular weight phosphotyrosine protein phosphatase [Bacteroidetes bacterium]|nr:MAG: low molecular weight phosphotyrosine protein phosphatase [Bacteroidota bacterium]RLD88975.1 MAG: low molecular weight phosphotyrosine protein phosphatase [Bacteroidota bacterium]